MSFMDIDTPSKLQKIIKVGHFGVTSEVGPPRSADGAVIEEKGHLIKDYVDAINVTDNQTSLPSGLQPGTVVESAELKLTRMVHYTMQGNEPATLVVEQVEVDAGVDAADVSRLKLGVHLGRVNLWGWNEPGLARNAVLTVALGSFTIKDGTAFRLRLIPPSSGQRWDMFSAEPLLCALAYTVAEAAPPVELQDPFEAILVNMGMSAEQARQFVLATRGGR